MIQYNRRTVDLVSATDAAANLLPLAEVKAYLRVTESDDDALLTTFTGAAVGAAEKYLRRALRIATYTMTLDGFPFSDDDALARLGSGTHQIPPSFVTGGVGEFDLPYPPVNSVTNITTYNRANVGAVLSASAYLLDNGRIILNDGYTWPTDLRARAGVKVTYVAGYGAARLPPEIKTGMMQHMAAMYDCRTGCDMPEAARGAMSGYRILDGLTW